VFSVFSVVKLFFVLTANKSQWFEAVFSLYNRNLFGRRFASLRAAGVSSLTNREKRLPLVLYANHSSWWDGLVAFEIGRRARLDQFVMMEERELEKLFLFRRLGAFSVNRGKPREVLESINYAGRLLTERENRALWIFPQGEIVPNDARPLRFQRGLEKILEKTPACLCAPVAMRYEFLGDFKPHAFARVGAPERFETTARLIENLTAELETLKQNVLNRDLSAYEKLLK
jgi:chlorobactene lauroyltransferase